MSKVIGVASPDRALIQAGVALFLIGLLTGFAVPFVALPRLALTSHLEGLLNGLFFIVLGLIWSRVRLGPVAASLAFWAAIYAGFANWLATLLGGVWGAAGMMPLAGGDSLGEPAQEQIVGALLISLSLAMVLACALILWGLRAPKPA